MISDVPRQVNITCTCTHKPVIDSSNKDDNLPTKTRTKIFHTAQPTPQSFNNLYMTSTVRYNFTSEFTGDDEASTIGFQFTESETTAILKHFQKRPHLKPEMQTPTTKLYDTDWNIFTPYLNLFLLGWNIFTHYLDLFLLGVLIKFVESSIFSMLSVLYSFIGLLELAKQICDTLCPPCVYLLHIFITTVLNILSNLTCRDA